MYTYMYEIKQESQNDIHSVCTACLSSGRKLSCLDEYADIYRIVCGDPHSSMMQVKLCWECMAVLRTVTRFRAKVYHAQVMMKLHPPERQMQQYTSLSSLQMAKQKEFRYYTFQELDTVLNVDIQIKEEPPDYQSSSPCFGDHNDDNFQPIKQEKQVKIETRRCKDSVKSRKRYRIISKRFKRGLKMSQKVPIKPEELDYWLERERNNDLYKNMQYKCTTCVYAWSLKEGYIAHNKKFHDQSAGEFVCDICQSRFAAKHALQKHVAKHYLLYECRVCRHRCCSTQSLAYHFAEHKKAIQCRDCDGYFHNLTLFYVHYKAQHPVFLCDHCGKGCRSKYYLEKHISNKHTHPIQCAQCGETFGAVRQLKRHVRVRHATHATHAPHAQRTATAEDAYCVLCDRQFRNAGLYRRHVSTSARHAHERGAARKSKPQKTHACSECGNVYSRRIYMINHYQHVHMKQSKHLCTYCDKQFLNRTRYLDHMRLNHEGVPRPKNKLCNICGRGFSANRTLINHIRTHTGERPYACTECDAKFAQKHAMLSHVKHVHMKIKRRTAWRGAQTSITRRGAGLGLGA